MARLRLHFEKKVLADLIRARFFGHGMVASDAPDDLTVVGVVDAALTDEGYIDLVIESAEYVPELALPDHKLPVADISFYITFHTHYGRFDEEPVAVAEWPAEETRTSEPANGEDEEAGAMWNGVQVA